MFTQWLVMRIGLKLTAAFLGIASLVAAAGSGAGVSENMPVVWGGAAVGRVVAVGPFSCRVLLLTDPASRISARSAGSGARGMAVGAGVGRLRMESVPHYARMRVGDTIVTAGVDGVFPPDFQVGTCVRASRKSGEFMLQVDVRPRVGGRSLECVEILLWRPPAAPRETGRRGGPRR